MDINIYGMLFVFVIVSFIGMLVNLQYMMGSDIRKARRQLRKSIEERRKHLIENNALYEDPSNTPLSKSFANERYWLECEEARLIGLL